MTPTFEGLREILVRDYELEPERLTPDTPLADVEIDSLAATELLFSLEERFEVAADDPAGVPFTTLGELADYIDRLLAERAAG